MSTVNQKARQWLAKATGNFIDRPRSVDGYRVEPGDLSLVESRTTRAGFADKTERLLIGQNGGYALKTIKEPLDFQECSSFVVGELRQLGLNSGAVVRASIVDTLTIVCLIYVIQMPLVFGIDYLIGNSLLDGVQSPDQIMALSAVWLTLLPLSIIGIFISRSLHRTLIQQCEPQKSLCHLSDEEARSWLEKHAEVPALDREECPPKL